MKIALGFQPNDHAYLFLIIQWQTIMIGKCTVHSFDFRQTAVEYLFMQVSTMQIQYHS